MDEQKKKQAEKLLNFAENKDLALFDEAQETNSLLEKILEKEPPTFPEFPVTDLSETNSLLQKLVERENEALDVSITLDLV